jgi:hypothetical protein
MYALLWSFMDKLNNVRWGTIKRLEFIEFKLFWDGSVNRSDLVSKFSVSIPQASADLKLYQEIVSDGCYYDSSLKAYRPHDNFVPKILQLSAEQYLSLLRLSNEGILESTSAELWTSSLPASDSLSVPQRKICPVVLRTVLQATRSSCAIEIEYHSMNYDRDVSNLRLIAPHSFGFDGFRWHARAFCLIDMRYKDFSLSRCKSAKLLHNQRVNHSQDNAWHNFFTVVITPNPALEIEKKRAIEHDYCMVDGELHIPVREAMLFYFHRRMRFDLIELTDNPKLIPVLIKNYEEYKLKI